MTIFEKDKIGRLALREEGDFWVAYYAQPHTMDHAFVLATINMRFVREKARRAVFMELMKQCMGDVIAEVTGQRPLWGSEAAAPDHERGKLVTMTDDGDFQ